MQQTPFPNRNNIKVLSSASSQTLLEPLEITINECKFIISKMPCTVAQEVLINLPQGLIPLLAEFSKYEQYIFKMLSYCERVYDDKEAVPLISKTIIDNNIPDFDTLYKLEWECINYNYDFFKDGRALTFLNEGLSLVKSNLTEILTALSDKFSEQAERHFGN